MPRHKTESKPSKLLFNLVYDKNFQEFACGTCSCCGASSSAFLRNMVMSILSEGCSNHCFLVRFSFYSKLFSVILPCNLTTYYFKKDRVAGLCESILELRVPDGILRLCICISATPSCLSRRSSIYLATFAPSHSYSSYFIFIFLFAYHFNTSHNKLIATSNNVCNHGHHHTIHPLSHPGRRATITGRTARPSIR